MLNKLSGNMRLYLWLLLYIYSSVDVQVRLVFEGCVETVGSPTSNTSDQVATADIVTACLESMVDDESDVAAQICK